MKLDYYFDFSCPYAYLGSTQITSFAAAHQADLEWKPILLGGIFKQTNTPMNLAKAQHFSKKKHGQMDIKRWAKYWQMPLQTPSAHPMSTVNALRTLLGCPKEKWPILIHEFFRQYWVLGNAPSTAKTIEAVLQKSALSFDEIQIAIEAQGKQEIKNELRRRTEAAFQAGVFGVPCIILSGGHLSEPFMIWGQDRLDLASAILKGWDPNAGSAPKLQKGHSKIAHKISDKRSIEFWYDFSSPFAYLAATQIQEVAARCNAHLYWRPLLLGGLFKTLGTPNVPLFEMSEQKQQYQRHDLKTTAAYYGYPFAFNSTFPLRTVQALRLALLAGNRIAELSMLIFRAAWVDKLDIGDTAVLETILTKANFDAPTMLAQCSDTSIKSKLLDNTTKAYEQGIFGVPTFILRTPDESQLFWGQDRIQLLEESCRTKP